jgi:hypothetical protein
MLGIGAERNRKEKQCKEKRADLSSGNGAIKLSLLGFLKARFTV